MTGSGIFIRRLSFHCRVVPMALGSAGMIIACVSLKCSLSQAGYTKSGCREREIVHARCMFHYLEYQRGIAVGHLLLLLSEIEHNPSTISFTKIMPASCPMLEDYGSIRIPCIKANSAAYATIITIFITSAE
jgi:hypothetical protein